MPLPFTGNDSTAKLVDRRRKLEETRTAIAASEKILVADGAKRQAIAAREAAGDLSATEAADEYAEQDALVARHAAGIDRLTRVAGLLEQEIDELEHKDKLAAHAEAVALVDEEQKSQVAAAASIAKALATVASAVGRLERSRAAVDAAADRAKELHVDGCGPLPIVDEPDWLGGAHLERVVDVLVAGPLQPNADRAARAAEANERREAQDAEIVRMAAESFLSAAVDEVRQAELSRVPARLRPRVEARVRELSAQRRARRDAQDEREKRPPRVTV